MTPTEPVVFTLYLDPVGIANIKAIKIKKEL